MKPELDVPINIEWQKKQISHKHDWLFFNFFYYDIIVRHSGALQVNTSGCNKYNEVGELYTNEL